MKSGRSLSELAVEIERRENAKRDFVAETRNLSVIDPPSGGPLALHLQGFGAFGMTDHFHRQLGRHIGIHADYYDRMRQQAPALLAYNANHWLATEPKMRMVRTLDGDARAYLSDSFRPLDNHDLMEVALPEIQAGGAEVVSCEVTDRRLYIKAIVPSMEFNLKARDARRRGDVVHWGFTISNSEVGSGSLRVDEFVRILDCLNGMTIGQPLRRAHLGRARRGSIEEVAEFYTQDTRNLDDAAFWSKVRDTVRAMFDMSRAQRRIQQLEAADEMLITGDPVEVVEVTGSQFRLTKDERRGVLRHLTLGGNLSQWGLMQAITATASDAGSYDRATEMESFGGQVLELPKQAWKKIAEAQVAA